MSTRRSTSSTQVDARLQKLKQLRQKIRDLQEEVANLEAQLVSEGVTVFRIQTLPSEILSMIFSQYLLNNPRLIRRLLFVCRRWYNIVVNDPTLWTVITLNIKHNEKDLEEMAYQLEPYVKACLKHSAKLLLDVEINCASLRSWRQQLDDTLLSALMDYFPHANDYILTDWVNGQDWYHFAQSLDEGDMPGHYSHFMGLLDCLNSNDIKNRFGSLNIILPDDADDDDISAEVLQNVTGSMPNLRVLSLAGGTIQDRRPVFKNLLSLRSLQFSDHGTFELIDPLPLRLHRLDFCERWSDKTVPILNSFKDLVTLKVHFESSQYLFPEDQFAALNLHKLESVHLAGWLEPTRSVAFHFPALKHLHLKRLSTNPILDRLPEIRASHVHLSIIRPFTPADKEALKKYLEQALDQYSFCTHIYVPAFAKHLCIGVIRQLKDKGSLNIALKALVLEPDFNEVEETIDIEDV